MSLPPDARNVLDLEIERINHQHQLAVRCLNPVLRLYSQRHFADGDRHGRAALIELCDAVKGLPSSPAGSDPFCRDDEIETAGETATSAHAAAVVIAQRTWDAAQLTSLKRQAITRHVDAEGTTYQRVTFRVARRSPTEGKWSADVWREACEGLDRHTAPDAGWFQAALALERNQAARRLEDRFRVFVTELQSTKPLENEPTVWRKEGELWTLTFENQTIRLRDRVGLRYIARLLAKKGSDTHAALLMTVESGHPLVQPLAGSEVLDDEARERYRKRYEDLEFQLEEAKRNGDQAKQENVQQEMNALAQQLSAATGLGGRKRRVRNTLPREIRSLWPSESPTTPMAELIIADQETG